VSTGIRSRTQYNDQLFQRVRLDAVELISSPFHGCIFKDCSLVESVLRGCRFVNCTFRGCNLGLVAVPDSTFASTRFEDSQVIGIDWTRADWSTGRLPHPLAFSRCALNHSTFIGLELPGIEITSCIAIDVDFREADLSGADFTDTDLADSLFSHTNLTGADLGRARNYRINAEQNIIKGARFSLPEAMSLLYSLDIILDDDQG
jgi:fluoroquinolone resistance protein